jgi:hypothetical protein
LKNEVEDVCCRSLRIVLSDFWYDFDWKGRDIYMLTLQSQNIAIRPLVYHALGDDRARSSGFSPSHQITPVVATRGSLFALVLFPQANGRSN